MLPTARPFDPRRPYNDLPRLPPTADIATRAILRVCIQARASSALENIVTTTDRLFQYAQDESQPADPATKEALRYRTALRRGFESLARRPLTTATAVDVCRTLRGIDIDIRKIPGAALTNAATGTVVYAPPEGQDLLRDLLANWERYLHDETTVDTMIRMAGGHYQFEAIHPFTD